MPELGLDSTQAQVPMRVLALEARRVYYLYDHSTFSTYKNEPLFALGIASRLNRWNDFANTLFVVY